MRAHREFVVGLLKAANDATTELRTGGDEALLKMGAIHAKIFGEQTAQYWADYFKGRPGTDALGNPVALGGSRVIGLAQEADFFGLKQGSLNVFQGVYGVFGDYDKTFYPTLVTDIPGYTEVVDTSYLSTALQGIAIDAPTATANSVVYTAETRPIKQVVSKKVWKIEFDSGKATIRPESFTELSQIAFQAGMTGLQVQVNGYTDNTGSRDVNQHLSQARAKAISDWLSQVAPNNFPSTRVSAHGFGPDSPVADNATADGRQQNRRVEIVMGE
jgi:outer membrane protein OmpA-like peptidoglycan-associated protein